VYLLCDSFPEIEGGRSGVGIIKILGRHEAFARFLFPEHSSISRMWGVLEGRVL
jgi:hypothetical protein